MILSRSLVLDANILLRGVLGVRVRGLLQTYEDRVNFYTPDVCLEDAKRYLPELAAQRHLDLEKAQKILDGLVQIVQIVDCDLYGEHEQTGRARISSRDAMDWPVIAAALSLDCPIWTEDRDFFGSGVATWTTGNVELYLRGA